MSKFQDNFFREEEQLLDYDDSAFYYFFISILSVTLIPYTLYLFKQMITGEKTIEKRKKAYKKTWVRFGFFFKLFVVGLLWYLWYLTADQIGKIKPLKSFDPFQILGIEPGSEPAVIKRAYRKLSLQKHPDKNPDDPLAVSEFIQITKAYATLTDETARENWEKYGNPDGPGSFHVAIALPRFLLQKEYQVQVLGAFFFFLLVLIPGYFYVNLDQSSKDVGGVDVENRKIYAYLINENLIYKQCPALLANSIELRGMKVKSQQEAQVLSKLKSNELVQELLPKANSRRGQQVDMKSLILIVSYMLRLEGIELLQEDIDFIMSKSPYHIEQMLQMAIALAMEFKMKRSIKRITAKNVLCLIEFSQNLTQALWKDDDAFLQVPHMNEERIKKLRKQKKLTIEEYSLLKPEERLELSLFDNPKQYQDAEKAIKAFPLIDLKVEYYVDGEKEVAVGDILTVKITITQLNLGEKEQSGFIHSNQFPYLKQNSWYLVFTDAEENDFLAMKKLYIKDRVYVEEIKDMMRNPGKMLMNIILKNDSYKGFDKQAKLELIVLKEVKRQEIQYAEEDIQAAKQPSLMQSVMEVNPNDSDDDEEEEDDNAKPQVAAQPQPQVHQHGPNCQHGHQHSHSHQHQHKHAHVHDEAKESKKDK